MIDYYIYNKQPIIDLKKYYKGNKYVIIWIDGEIEEMEKLVKQIRKTDDEQEIKKMVKELIDIEQNLIDSYNKVIGKFKGIHIPKKNPKIHIKNVLNSKL